MTTKGPGYVCASTTGSRRAGGVIVTFAHEQLGTVALNRADYKSAARHFRRAVKASNRLGDQRRLAIALDCLGEAHAHLGRDADASHAFQRALAVAHAAAAPDAACLVHIDLAKLAQGFGSWPLPRDAESEPPDWESARFHASQALDLAQRLGDIRAVIGALIALSVALNGAGDEEQAITTTRQAADLAREHRLPHEEVAALVQEALILEGLGRGDEAEERLAAADALKGGAGAGGAPPGIPEPPPPSPARLDRHVVLRSLLFPAFGVVIALAAIALRGWSWLWAGYGALMTAALWEHYDRGAESAVKGFQGRAGEIFWGLTLPAAGWVACLALYAEHALDAVLWWCVAAFIPVAYVRLRFVRQRREERRISQLPDDF